MVTITLPEELPVNETLELLRKARQMASQPAWSW